MMLLHRPVPAGTVIFTGSSKYILRRIKTNIPENFLTIYLCILDSVHSKNSYSKITFDLRLAINFLYASELKNCVYVYLICVIKYFLVQALCI